MTSSVSRHDRYCLSDGRFLRRSSEETQAATRRPPRARAFQILQIAEGQSDRSRERNDHERNAVLRRRLQSCEPNLMNKLPEFLARQIRIWCARSRWLHDCPIVAPARRSEAPSLRSVCLWPARHAGRQVSSSQRYGLASAPGKQPEKRSRPWTAGSCGPKKVSVKVAGAGRRGNLTMIYELRVYRVLPGRMPNLLAQFKGPHGKNLGKPRHPSPWLLDHIHRRIQQ